MDTWQTILYVAIFLFQLICMALVFVKADKPAWGCIIPIYNVVLLCDIARISRWWTIGIFIPIVNIITWVLLAFGVSRNFGRSGLFALGLLLLPPIFYAILGFGGSRYR